MKLIGALLARNEAAPDRYLERALHNAKQFCTALVCVDDGSTDATASIAARFGAAVLSLPSNGWWGKNESAARAALWTKAASLAEDGWIYCFDADHEMLGPLDQVARLCEAEHVNAWAFPLYDCWDSEEQMRTDGFWRAHLHPRPWMVRAKPTPDFAPQWARREIHVGHLPSNYPLLTGVAPATLGIRHLGYVKQAHRAAKHAKYISLSSLAPEERAHAESILSTPTLTTIPPKRPKILVASVLRKPKAVLDAFFKTLLWQQLRDPGADIHYSFIENFAPGEEGAGGVLLPEALRHADLKVVPAPAGDYGENAQTRTWTPTAWHRVGALKNRFLTEAIAGGYDCLWLVDADVLCDPFTLQSLLDAEAPIVSGVYWTNWMRNQSKDAAQVQHAGPQVWLRGSYGLSGRGWTEASFRAALVGRQRVRVWGLGACTLIRRSVLEKGISFEKKFELPGGPMSDGEDRHFCMQAEIAHVEMYADAWPDIYHAYHPAEYGEIPAQLDALNAKRWAEGPALGNLVSATLENLEVRGLPPQFIRGRLGQIKLLPEVEEKLHQLRSGESALFKAHFPAHYPFEQARNRDFLLRLTLLDSKAFRLPPVIDKELFVGALSKSVIDHTTLTEKQIVDIATHGTAAA